MITSTQRELTNGVIEHYSINYTNLDNIYMFNAMIPPAGDSIRIDTSWAYELRNSAIEHARKLTYGDELFICGISYWHVDRAEIDQLLINIHADINVKSVNPDTPSVLNAVLTSLFNRHVNYKKSDILGAL
ncbi:hypothetical protein D3C75_964200 [compost metagenome]